MSEDQDNKSQTNSNESLAQRRARLRGSLTKQATSNIGFEASSSQSFNKNTPENPQIAPMDEEGSSSDNFDFFAIEDIDNSDTQQEVESKIVSDLPNQVKPEVNTNNKKSKGKEKAPDISESISKVVEENLNALDSTNVQTIKNLDLGIEVLSTNISQIYSLLKDSIEVKSNTQANSMSEVVVNLTYLVESLNASLEPLKAVGELVPAISELVGAIDQKFDQSSIEQAKLNPDELLNNLAFQLSKGDIDPWTFKCAYMSIFPDEHPADLLHRLVQLLGTQRIPGELFRAAYEAVQNSSPPNSSGVGVDYVAQNKLLREIEELKINNSKLNEALVKQEQLLSQQLILQDQQLAESNEDIKQKFEELNANYIEQNQLLIQKENDLNSKTSEASQLKAQIEELTEQYKDMITKLQQEIQNVKEENQSLKSKSIQPTNVSPQVVAQPAKPLENKPLFKTDLKSTTIEPGFFDDNPVDDSANFFDPNLAQQESQHKTGLLEQNNVIARPQKPQEIAPQIAPQIATPQPGINIASGTNSQANSGVIATNSSYDFSYKKPMAPGPQPSAMQSSGVTGNYGSGIRSQVFEVIVRQALEGQDWRKTCSGPMKINSISAEEVEAEVARRKKLLNQN